MPRECTGKEVTYYDDTDSSVVCVKHMRTYEFWMRRKDDAGKAGNRRR